MANVEVVAVLDGPATAPPLRGLWELAESWWEHPGALLAMIEAEIALDPIVMTLGARPQRNLVREVTADGVWVETAASRAKGGPAQLVPAPMIQIAWDWLHSHGSLTNAYLLATDGLNVKRSSFVCALLARLPGVEVTPSRPIELRTVACVRGPASR